MHYMYMKNSTVVYMVKMESLPEIVIAIFSLKIMVEGGLNFFLNSSMGKECDFCYKCFLLKSREK